jgi:pSer/pThr/pTyr-binding forkhead associated (FHA) protein
MASPPRREDPDATNQTSLPTPGSPDEQPTGALQDLGAVAELRAQLTSPGPQDRKTLPLYSMPDTVVVGRGTACDWQIDDSSLSRKHAQFSWNGRQLTVEDLGSANGTRVNGRPARNPTAVAPGDSVQLGTVIITFELKGAPKASPDEQATRLVQSPEGGNEDMPSDPGLPPLGGAPTVVRPQPQPGPANTQASVFRPEKDAARPDEPTRPWDPRAALVRTPEKAFDSEFVDKLKDQWRTNRRMFVLAGAAAWIAILLIVWSAFEKPQVEDDPFAQVPQKVTAPKPVVTQLDPPKPVDVNANGNVNGNGNDSVSDADRDDALEKAVAAYDQGRMPEALGLFKRLAADGKDASAKFMVDLIESQKGAAP